jgi:hypothetical protein
MITGRPTKPIILSEEMREQLDAIMNSRSSPTAWLDERPNKIMGVFLILGIAKFTVFYRLIYSSVIGCL